MTPNRSKRFTYWRHFSASVGLLCVLLISASCASMPSAHTSARRQSIVDIKSQAMGRHAAVLLVINVPDESPRSPVGKPQFGHLIQEIPVPRLPYVFNLATLSPAFPHMHGTLTIERISDRTLKMTMASGNTGHTTETAMGSTSVQSVSYAIEPHSPHQDQVLFTYLEAP